MPDWKTHSISGLLLVVLWMYAYRLPPVASLTAGLGLDPFGARQVATLVLVTMAASLFPDIDTRNSKVRDFGSMALAAAVSFVYSFSYPGTWFYGPAYFAVLYLVLRNLPTKHRGITHTMRFSLAFSLGAVAAVASFSPLNVELCLWFMAALLGYSTHLAIDRI